MSLNENTSYKDIVLDVHSSKIGITSSEVDEEKNSVGIKDVFMAVLINSNIKEHKDG